MEVKEVLKALNLPEDLDTIEKVVEKHNGTFIPMADAHTDDRVVEKVTGKLFGGLTTTAKRLFGLKSEDIKDLKFEDIMAKGAEGFTKKITELQNTGADEKLIKLNGELETVKTEAKQYKDTLDKVVVEKTALEENFNTKIKAFKLDTVLNDAKAKLPLKDGITDVEKAGFDSIIRSKYSFEYDDKDNPIVKDREGKRIPNPKKSGEFLDISAVLEMEADSAKLKKNNPLPGGQKIIFGQPNPGIPGAEAGSKIHPKAQRQMATVIK